MLVRPTVVCPIDFSPASRGALRYAAAIAEHFYAALTVVAVDDPLLRAAADANFSPEWMPAMTREALGDFLADAFPQRRPKLPEIKLEIAVGQPALEILRTADAGRADLIVMSTHGMTGVRKLAFGSITERVLRETPLPVLVTPGADPGPVSLEAIIKAIKTILVPVDLTPVTQLQVRIASGLADALGAGVVLSHVLEPLRGRPSQATLLAAVDRARELEAHDRMTTVAASVQAGTRCTIDIARGDPSSEIARVAHEVGADLVVMGLHSSNNGGPRMGSITYRVLCRSLGPILALPPALTLDARWAGDLRSDAVMALRGAG